MSVSTQSYESIIKLATIFYDPNMPLYFVHRHIEMTCDVLLLLLQQKTMKLVVTTSILLEPIIENNGIIYISTPLLGLLINELVELPKNTVDFVDNFDIFKDLDYGVSNKDETYSCFDQPKHDSTDFTPNERIRFTHVIRIVFMCSHFLQHYIDKIPYTTHNKPLNHLERAVQIENLLMPVAIEIPTIDYSRLSNM